MNRRDRSAAWAPVALTLAFLLTVAAAPAAAKTKVNYWFNQRGSQEENDAILSLVAEFEAAHPDIEVESTIVPGAEYYDKLASAFAGGVAPDVFYVRPGQDRSYVDSGMTYDLSSFVERDRAEVRPDDFIPAQLRELTYHGKIWALPFDFSVLGVYYNKDMFDSVGESYPDASWTWERLIDVGRKFIVREGEGAAPRWALHYPGSLLNNQWSEGYFLSYDGPLFSEDYSRSIANNAGVVRALEVLREMGESETTFLPGQNNGGGFPQGRTAMLIGGSWATVNYRSAFNFSWDVAMLPAGAEGTRVVSGTGGAWTVSGTAKDPQAAWEFVKWLGSPHAARKLIVDPVRSLPPRMSLMHEWVDRIAADPQPPRNAAVFVEEAGKFGRGVPPVTFQYAKSVRPYAAGVIAGDISPSEAAIQIQKSLDAELGR